MGINCVHMREMITKGGSKVSIALVSVLLDYGCLVSPVMDKRVQLCCSLCPLLP